MAAKFGTAGNPQSFYDEGFTASKDMPQFLKSKGLDAYEYQCGKGVSISEATAKVLGQNAKEYGIDLSVHAPYYINLANPEEEKINLNIGYVISTLRAARAMGAKRIVLHTGSLMKMTRREALENAKRNLSRILDEVFKEGMEDISICPETMGKINQLGDLKEVMELCAISEKLIPTIDFGHLNARTLGGIKAKEDYQRIIDEIACSLGDYYAKNFHSHFSKIEYTAGGEKKHLTFTDSLFGPDFEPLAQVIAEMKLSPVIICESAGTQSIDAAAMKNMLERVQSQV
ncbi:endonuclease 4 [bioreactor metagenome]|uniref:Endonuclease 4 n=1 Tax=bioreactor metagenome TaxID=1076179 RepID=A0A645BTV5_9ZZZZ